MMSCLEKARLPVPFQDMTTSFLRQSPERTGTAGRRISVITCFEHWSVISGIADCINPSLVPEVLFHKSSCGAFPLPLLNDMGARFSGQACEAVEFRRPQYAADSAFG